MIQTLDLEDFRQAFRNMDRGEQFSYDALELIFNYLEECDPDMELDVIAICCDFYEGNYLDILADLDLDESDTEDLDEDELAQLVADELSNLTSVLGVTDENSIVYQAY